MQEVFKKIIEKINEAGGCDATSEYDKGWDEAIEHAIEIVKHAAAECNGGWILCSGCSDCKHKECDNYGKV